MLLSLPQTAVVQHQMSKCAQYLYHSAVPDVWVSWAQVSVLPSVIGTVKLMTKFTFEKNQLAFRKAHQSTVKELYNRTGISALPPHHR